MRLNDTRSIVFTTLRVIKSRLVVVLNGVPSEKSGGSSEGMPSCILLTLKCT